MRGKRWLTHHPPFPSIMILSCSQCYGQTVKYAQASSLSAYHIVSLLRSAHTGDSYSRWQCCLPLEGCHPSFRVNQRLRSHHVSVAYYRRNDGDCRHDRHKHRCAIQDRLLITVGYACLWLHAAIHAIRSAKLLIVSS